jgi:hypothetical protein
LASLRSETAVEQDAALPASKWEAFVGKTLGLHCLFDPINNRVSEVIRRLVPDIDITIDKSGDCSEHLQALCKKSDVLVVVTQHAKHAATNCVDRHAKPPTIVLKSRRARIGSSGVLQVLEDYADQHANVNC